MIKLIRLGIVHLSCDLNVNIFPGELCLQTLSVSYGFTSKYQITHQTSKYGLVPLNALIRHELLQGAKFSSLH